MHVEGNESGISSMEKTAAVSIASSAASSFSNGSSPATSDVASAPTAAGGSSQSGSQAGSSSGAAGSSGSSSSTNWDRVNTAKTTFDVAKAKLKEIPPDYETAIDLLDQVCVVLKEELGDLNIETCDALYYYGSALLDAYQLGSDLMGQKATAAVHQYPTDAVVSGSSSSSGPALKDSVANTVSLSEKESVSTDTVQTAEVPLLVEDGESRSSNESDLESLPGGGPLDGTEENGADEEDDDEMADESADTIVPLDDMTAENDSRKSLSAGNGKSKSEGDSIAELRYAWEIFEISRVGYEKRMLEGASHAEKLRLSDLHYKLSLCAAENGEQNIAIVEAERSLKVCQEACDPTDRDLAEAYFNLGSVYSMYSLLSEAADNMKKAVAILEARKVQCHLELKLFQTKTEDALDGLPKRKKLEKELLELNELIPDLMGRLQDTYEDMRLGSDEAKRLLDNWLKGVTDKCHSDAGEPVVAPPPMNDISHLVRRVQPKRPSAADEEESVKRLKGTNGTAADSSTSHFSNATAVSDPALLMDTIDETAVEPQP